MLGLAHLLALTLSAASACAVCSCGDPTLTAMGAEQPFRGRARVAAAASQRTDAIGTAGIDRLEISEQLLTLSAAWSPSDRWQVAASQPLGRRDVTDVSLARTTVWSPGDPRLRARWVAWRGQPARGAAMVGLGGGLRLPAAPVARGADGEALPASAQLGAGVPIATLGAWGFRSGRRLATFGGVEAGLPAPGPTRADFDARPGASARATAALQWQPWMRAAVRGSLEGRLDAVATEGGAPEADSGGALVYSRLDLVVTPVTDVVAQIGVAVPTAQALYGDHHEGPVFGLEVIVDL